MSGGLKLKAVAGKPSVTRLTQSNYGTGTSEAAGEESARQQYLNGNESLRKTKGSC
jgi:hypothetical protein